MILYKYSPKMVARHYFGVYKTLINMYTLGLIMKPKLYWRHKKHGKLTWTAAKIPPWAIADIERYDYTDFGEEE